MPLLTYCEDLFTYRRRPTHEVRVGDVGIGGTNPIRIQSMTAADTMDTEATVREVMALVEAGCEIVRITAPSIRAAGNLREIKKRLRQAGITVPLVADIHYTPHAALIAAEIVEKVRINPGNYADKKRFEVREYTDAAYAAELERIYERFAPLVQKCKVNGVAMRIGVNHGSLSDRIMNRYGDTPEGMVQSALEFLAMCEELGYREVVLSMKASNPQVMIQAYRLLAARLYEQGMTYPFHLGVTEAGDGVEGRLKSAVGIGALLEDGLGDTIRVSLTEDAVHEIPVARGVVAKYNHGEQPCAAPPGVAPDAYLWHFPPFVRQQPKTYRVQVHGAPIGDAEPVRVAILATALRTVGTGLPLPVLGQTAPDHRPEWVFADHHSVTPAAYRGLPVVCPWPEQGDVALVSIPLRVEAQPALLQLDTVLQQARERGVPVYFALRAFAPATFSPPTMVAMLDHIITVCDRAAYWQVLFGLRIPAGVLGSLGGMRQACTVLAARACQAPVVLEYGVPSGAEHWQLDAAATLGALLCEGLGNGVLIDGAVTAEEALRFSYGVLQATRRRISQAEFISCPSCGRTQFDLQATTACIKAQTRHLTGVKIAIMGCIVNGPGEMADADFGYVGAGPGTVNLFVGKACVARHIPEALAAPRLIDLIKRHGKWVEP